MLTHEIENNQDSEKHLSENREKFESDCLFLLKEMMKGRRLSAQDVNDMKINDRRLRELFSEGKCKKEWKLNENGKRMFVQYFIPKIETPSKTKNIEKAKQFFDLLKNKATQIKLL